MLQFTEAPAQHAIVLRAIVSLITFLKHGPGLRAAADIDVGSLTWFFVEAWAVLKGLQTTRPRLWSTLVSRVGTWNVRSLSGFLPDNFQAGGLRHVSA